MFRARFQRLYAEHMAPAILHLLSVLRGQGGKPAITWYGPGTERIELSAAVVDNWVVKVAGLLAEELNVGQGTRVWLDLPTHWRTVVWALAAWRCGATVLTGSTPPGEVDVAVTDRPDEVGDVGERAELVVVTLDALARSYPGELPVGAIDGASAALAYGDVLAWAPEPSESLQLRAADGREVPVIVTPSGSARVILQPARRDDVSTILADTAGVLAAGGSVVLLNGRRARALGLEGFEKLLRNEKIDEVQ